MFGQTNRYIDNVVCKNGGDRHHEENGHNEKNGCNGNEKIEKNMKKKSMTKKIKKKDGKDEKR